MNSDRNQLLEGYQNPIYQIDLSSYTAVGLFEEMCRRIPEEVALVDGEERLTYAEVNRKANRIGQVILELDDSFPQVVSALADNGAKMNLMEMGVIKARKILLGLLPGQPFDRLVEVLKDSGAQLLVYSPETQELAQQLASELGLALLNIDDLEGGQDNNLELDYQPEDLVTIGYTSGSTGKPKGIVRSHLNLVHSVAVHAEMGMDANERFFSIYNFSYGNGLIALFKAWLLGGVLYPFDLNKQGISELIDLIRDQELTVYHTPPSVFRNFIKSVSPGSLPSLRWIHLGGEPVVARDIELFKEKFLPGCKIFNNMGSSEAASMMRYLMDHDTVLEDGVVPIGYPSERIRAAVVDEQGNPVEIGQVGELVVQSGYLSSGYWNDPELTAERFKPVVGSREKKFSTGDLVCQRPDGCFVYAGRKDSQVKVRGSRVVVAELEEAICRIPGVAQAVIRVDENTAGSPRLSAYVVPDMRETITQKEIRSTLAAKLPIHMIPHHVAIISELPRTSTGKVDRKSLPMIDKIRPDLASPPEPPVTQIEEELAGIWEDIFQMDGIGVTDNFFDLGGDSLMAVELFVEIEKVFGRRFPISLLIQASNIRQQAKLVQEIQQADPWLPLVEFNAGGTHLPLFCFAGKGGNPIKFRQLAVDLGEEQPVYFLQSRGLSGMELPFSSVEEIAADYLRAIRRVQPHGPFRLLGSSFGGKVAYEAARQLHIEGEPVDFVLMLDTYATGYPLYIKPPSKLWRRIRKGVGYFEKHWQSLRQGDWIERKNYLKYYWDLIPVIFQERRQRRRLANEEKERYTAMPDALKIVESSNLKASRQYRTPPFPGRVVLLRALVQPVGIVEDDSLGWSETEIGELMIHNVEGHHGNLLMPPYVNQVVEILSQYI